jgi:hypothetical protein
LQNNFQKFLLWDQYCRLQWPRGLRHELSSPDRTLGSWVRIPLKAWMFVQGVLPTILGLTNWSETKRFPDALCFKVRATGKRESVGGGGVVKL